MDHPGVGVRCLYELRAKFDVGWGEIKSMEYSAFVTFADCEIKQQLLQRNGRPKNHSSSAVQQRGGHLLEL